MRRITSITPNSGAERERGFVYPFLEKLAFDHEGNDDPWDLFQGNASYEVRTSYQACL
jgi:hypothetical protein